TGLGGGDQRLQDGPLRVRQVAGVRSPCRSHPSSIADFYDSLLEVRQAYEEGFLRVTQLPFRLPAMADALLHAFGYFKKALSPKEKAHFQDLLVDFREQRVPLEAPLALLRSWALRFGAGYLEAQALFEPYPRGLMDLTF
ncbi:hypothetical protein CSW25_03825, partial [Thermus scotoductus]